MRASFFRRGIALCLGLGAATFGTHAMGNTSEIVGIGGNCLDVTGGDTANGTPVQMWRCEGGHENQQWIFDNGRIVWAGTKKCLDVTGGDRANGTLIQIWQCQSGNENQQFALDGGRIVWAGTRKCLDVSGGGTRNGTEVQIWDCQRDNPNQRWSIRAVRLKR